MTKTYTNTELLTATGPLTELQKQRQFLARVAITPIVCMICRKQANLIEAAGLTLDEYDITGTNEPDFVCPNCGKPVTYEITLTGDRFFAGKP